MSFTAHTYFDNDRNLSFAVFDGERPVYYTVFRDPLTWSDQVREMVACPEDFWRWSDNLLDDMETVDSLTADEVLSEISDFLEEVEPTDCMIVCSSEYVMPDDDGDPVVCASADLFDEDGHVDGFGFYCGEDYDLTADDAYDRAIDAVLLRCRPVMWHIS